MGSHHRALRRRIQYTGESWQAVRHDRSIDDSTPIPYAPTTAQCELESSVLEALKPDYLFPRPYGVRRVRPRADGTLVIHLDEASTDGQHRLGPSFLGHLLPYTYDGETQGQPGVRVRARALPIAD